LTSPRLAQRGLGVHPLVLNLVLVRVERHRLLVLVHRPPQRAAPVTFEQVAVLASVQRAGPPGKVLFEQPPGRQEVALVAERLVPLDQLVLVHANSPPCSFRCCV